MTKSGALLALPQDFVILTVKTLLKSRLIKGWITQFLILIMYDIITAFQFDINNANVLKIKLKRIKSPYNWREYKTIEMGTA